jgi:hypothetical protein
VSTTFPHFGALTATHSTAMLHDPLEEVVWVYEVDAERGTCLFRPRRGGPEVELPLDPMHGTIGVAPAGGEVFASITPGAHGGNMDTPEMRAGTTAYFGVNVPGGQLSLGDGHCRQGEGEVCGTAVEAAMRTVVVDLIKGGAPAWPRLENDEFLMSTGSTRWCAGRSRGRAARSDVRPRDPDRAGHGAELADVGVADRRVELVGIRLPVGGELGNGCSRAPDEPLVVEEPAPLPHGAGREHFVHEHRELGHVLGPAGIGLEAWVRPEVRSLHSRAEPRPPGRFWHEEEHPASTQGRLLNDPTEVAGSAR